MLPGMNADPAALAKESESFGRIAQELNTVMHHVEMIGDQLKANLKSPAAGMAAQSALIRFHEAATKVNTELDEISQNIGVSGTHYSSTDDDQAQILAGKMM